MGVAARHASEHFADFMVSHEQPHQQKRPRDTSSPADEQQQPRAKRRKTGNRNYSPQFWDSLSKIPLTRRALQEFDRRTKLDRSTPSAGTKKSQVPPRRLLRSGTRRLKDLAKEGGPDLSQLRGYADTTTSNAVMSQSSSHRSKRTRSSSRSKSRTSDKTRTTTYSAEFVQKIMDRGVYLDGYEDSDGEAPEPGNIDAMRKILAESRASLSPSRFTEEKFKDFRKDNQRATSEGDAMAQVIPTIIGLRDKQAYSAGTIPFYRLAKLDPELSAPNPDKYYGARPKQIHERVREDLDQYIIPSNATSRPAAPNFFLEGKSTSGKPDVAQRQAMYDGWVGARGMLRLQNYGRSSLVYDGNAYTMAATYSDGQLKMYATHPKESAGGGTEYYMTQLDTYAMTGNANGFRVGAAAYRNAREWTQQQRDVFIADANATALKVSTERASVSRTESQEEVSTVPEGSFSSETSVDELALDSQSSAKRPRGSRTQTADRNAVRKLV